MRIFMRGGGSGWDHADVSIGGFWSVLTPADMGREGVSKIPKIVLT